jgi:hypothetical protein
MTNNTFQTVHCGVNKSLTHAPILRQMNPVHTLPSHLSKIRFNIIPSTPRSSMLSLFSGLPLQKKYEIYIPENCD